MRSQIAEKEPMPAKTPPLAAWAPDDFALGPAAFARQLLTRARDFGTCARQGAVDAAEMFDSRVLSVVVEGQKLTFYKEVLNSCHFLRLRVLRYMACIARR